MKVKFGILASHPIQYQAPLFRRLARHPDLDVEVLFCHDHGVRPTYDPGFGTFVQFDVPLTEGFSHRFLRNRSHSPSVDFFGLVNPEVTSLVGSGRFDAFLVHGYASVTNLLALAASRRSRTSLLMRGDSNLRQLRGGATLALKSLILPALFGAVDQFLAIGTANADYYRHYGVSDDRISLAPFSVDNTQFRPATTGTSVDREAVRRSFGIGVDLPVFLFCSKLLPRKRPLDLLRAFSRALVAAPCELVIVGDGPLSNIVASEIRRLGIGDSVHVLGFRNQSELPSIYSMCDAFILPSENEPWGLVVNEAMSCGLAVAVADGVGAAPDLVQGVGEIFRCGDIQSLANILAKWASDPGTLRESRAKAATRIASWSLDATVAGFLAGIEAALRRKGA